MTDYIAPKLAKFILTVWDEGQAMRSSGATLATKLEHWRDRVLTYAHAQGLVMRERDLPPWMLRTCPQCNGNGWAEFEEILQGQAVPVFRRCTCRPMSTEPSEERRRQDRRKFAENWK
jgi:hypothetical protein